MRWLLIPLLLVACNESFVADGGGGGAVGDVLTNTPEEDGGSGADDSGSGGSLDQGTGGNSAATGGQGAGSGGQDFGSGGNSACQPGVCGIGEEGRKSYCSPDTLGEIQSGQCIKCPKKWFDCNDDGSDGCEIQSEQGNPCQSSGS